MDATDDLLRATFRVHEEGGGGGGGGGATQINHKEGGLMFLVYATDLTCTFLHW